MLKRIPFLAIAVMLFTIFFVSAVFIYCSPMSGLEAGMAEKAGRVLGVSATGGNYRWEELYGVSNLFPTSDDAQTAPERRETSDDMCVAASGAAVLDGRSGKILFGQEQDKSAPIASITKLMTALVFMDHNPGWDYVYKIGSQDNVEEGRAYIYSGEKVKVRDLFYLSLVGSANTAAMALVNSTGLNVDDFVVAMNARAEKIGLARTHFVDPVGLSCLNVSTAEEVARLAAAALDVEEIRDATLTRRYEFTTAGGRKASVANTDALLELFPQNGIKILGGKTGYTESAGYCFAGRFTDAAGHEIVSAILGAASPKLRFSQTGELVEWIYGAYQWRDTSGK